MNCILRIIFVFLILLPTAITTAATKPRVEIDTNMGKITVELEQQRAPMTVANFLNYVKKGFYSGTIFHRVISNFMIQGGGFDVNLSKKPTRSPIRNESSNGLDNSVGTIAMARTQDPHSATSQFYINVKDNRSLNATFNRPGYTVFGKVISGLDVAMNISEVPVQAVPFVGNDVPVETVIINSITLLEPESTNSSDNKSENTNTIKEKI